MGKSYAYIWRSGSLETVMGFSLKKLVAPALGAIFPSAAFGAVTGLGEAGLNYIGEKEARSADISSAREQMAFQKGMSDTAHQREVEDLKKAGLNPALSANSGASTPAGAGYDAQNLFGGVNNAIGSAMSLAKLSADLQETKARTRNTNADADLKENGSLIGKFTGTKGAKTLRQMLKSINQVGLDRLKNLNDSKKNKQDFNVTPRKGDYNYGR